MNRIVKEDSEFAKAGDLIIDTLTDSSKREVHYYFMAKEWPGLKEDATIWLDGDKLGHTTRIVFRNTSEQTVPWTIQEASIRPVPNTQVKTDNLTCLGLKHLRIIGDSDSYPGLLKWAPERTYCTGYFGFHITNTGAHGIHTSTLDGGTIELRGFEGQGGFDVLRLYDAQNNIVCNSLYITNFYVHDTKDGELFYLGSTQSGGKVLFKNVRIHNGFMVRAAAEALQLQHLGGSNIHNLIIKDSGTNWLSPFSQGQDTTIQWVIASGENNIRDLIVDGFSSMGFMGFGSDRDLQNVNSSTATMDNVLFANGLDLITYFHNSAKYGTTWKYSNIFYGGFDKASYKMQTGKVSDSLLSPRYGTDNISIGDITEDANLPYPSYVNSGFKSSEKIKQWSRYIASYYERGKAGSVPSIWQPGDIAIDNNQFFRCIRYHESTEIRPAESSNFIKLTWDSKGNRSDSFFTWNSKDTQSDTPPDDLRLTKGSYWRQQGMGLQDIAEKEQILEEYYYDGKRYTVTDSGTYIKGE